jgi:hypothetical protein
MLLHNREHLCLVRLQGSWLMNQELQLLPCFVRITDMESLVHR